MPALKWEIFTNLPGSPEKNFELLCRGIVRQKFGSFGVFHALANQPGVEFHLKLDTQCDGLGDASRWWGWQCKWYELSPSGELGSTRRAKIEEGLRKSETYLPGLTDWVLWTRRTLTKSDQKWFSGLSSRMRLHLWTSDEVDNLLNGQAAVLRSTYFGELVLTPDTLREHHEHAVAPIRTRWQPDVHHVGEAERKLRRMLGESNSWNVLQELSSELRTNAQAVETSPPAPPLLAPVVTNVIVTSRQSADTLDKVAEGICCGDLDLLRDELTARPRTLPTDVAIAPRRLRSGNHRVGLYSTNAVAACRDALRLLDEIETDFASRAVAVLAPAGCGKTQLAAQLTSGTATRPPGVLLHGRELHATHSADDLARRLSIASQPMPSMEALLAAVDAAGQRTGHRLPVVIDGLNEAEDPRMWKALLASLEATLTKYPYVLLVCTLRPEFVDDALPDGMCRVKMQGYGKETTQAIREHFHYWKIDYTDAVLPQFLKHPLTLRLFCEVTNPTRKQIVGVNAMPGSLTALFDLYLEQASVRVVELASRVHRFYTHDVNKAISVIANKLWEERNRSIEFDELRTILNDTQRPWDQSLVRALEHEGVLIRIPSDGHGAFMPVYDLLAGHIVANALLVKHGQGDFETWFRQSSTTTLLAGGYDDRHPLADDIVASLVGQLPRRFHAKQIWQMVDEPLCGRALRLAAQLEQTFFDAATIDRLLDLVRKGDAEILDRFWNVRGLLGHPLNAEGLDRALRTMAVSDRDLRWTEWLRKHRDGESDHLKDLEHLEQRWRSRRMRTGDLLRARWVMWTLTSTVRRLRDQATRALYWFGRANPEGLFELTIDSLVVNDAYVGERMLAASYGVVMAHQLGDADFAAPLKLFLHRLAEALVGASATAPTLHYLARLYVRGIVAFATKFYMSTLPNVLSGPWAFASPAPIQILTDGDVGADEAGRTLHMDFKNYTLGRLFDDRGNYDMDHAGHRAAVAYVRGVVWALGWRQTTLGTIDNRITEGAYGYGSRNRPRAERYGKKYGWIGFFTYAGLLEEREQFPRKNYSFSDVDIDPSFPEKPLTDGNILVPDAWLLPSIKDDESWMRKGNTSMPLSLFRREMINEHRGPWLAAHGFIKVTDRILGREVWAFISAFITEDASAPLLCSALKDGIRPRKARDLPSDYYIFAGEIPWHPNFASIDVDEDAYREKVTVDTNRVNIEVLAHEYAWESYHSQLNRAGSVPVPSRLFSTRFDLRSGPQSFDQFLPDGTRAAITLGGVDGLDGNILYIREDLLRQYVGERAIVWFAFGERELQPYPPSPPNWLVEVQRQQANEWRDVLTDADFKQGSKQSEMEP